MELNKYSLISFGLGLLVGMLVISLLDKKFGPTGELLKQPDTTYNKVKLDSINVQIGKHDTTIYKLNIKLKDDVEKSYQLSDSATVDLFRKLSTGTDKDK